MYTYHLAGLLHIPLNDIHLSLDKQFYIYHNWFKGKLFSLADAILTNTSRNVFFASLGKRSFVGTEKRPFLETLRTTI